MYNHNKIEKKWQKFWLENKTFKTTNDKNKKFYVLDMFPYPSGSGLHVGHPEGYTATDIIARYKRLNNFDVLHPIGWDAFGLPAEQYAIQTGNNPATFTEKNINTFRKQLQSLGFSYDYDKEVNTTDPKYYKWTQWIFAQMYKQGLAEIREIEVNWCEGLGTVLANEEVIDDGNGNKVSERGGFPVIKKPMRQWVLKITNYADKLLEGLNEVDWPNSLISLQRNWIGKEIKDGKITYHLKDWVFARQRYWGEPFPIAFDKHNNVLLIEDLVELPIMENIKPSGTGESPLANNKEWINFEKEGKIYRRDSNTMPQWAGSSWYYLAYILKNDDGSYTPLNSQEAYKKFEKWLPVDLYIGGQEHAVLHLLYARFWHKVLYDLKIVPTSEPFYKLVNQGMILGTDNQKMSKSRGNVINPNEIIEQYGADTLRVYEMFMGPLTDSKPWNTNTMEGTKKWLDRVWRLFEKFFNKELILEQNFEDEEIESIYHETIKEVTKNIEELKFNIAISKMMVYINYIYKLTKINNIKYLKDFLILLNPFAPHISEELMEKIGFELITNQEWPKFDESKICQKAIVISIQVNGKLRGTIEINENATEEEIKNLAIQVENVSKFIDGKQIKKYVYIKNKNINFVI
ncbi:class I tRNA ligase family protein [Mesomycoplasma moatsii]|uniref:class I tRNA ligase family protein n=1 Tax=Mesomycoplasma moatsii TaxID=171287 RepID=UPI0003B70170